MGGYGSGPYGFMGSKAGKKTVESCYCLDIAAIKQKQCLVAGTHGTWHWNNNKGEKDVTIGFKAAAEYLELYYTVLEKGKDPEEIRYRVQIDETDCNYGNTRPWFLCPGVGCGERVRKLYLRGKYFMCRHCHRLQYSSCQESGDPCKEARRKVNRLKKKLGAKDLSWLSPIPDKPKGMHWETYCDLLRDIERAEWEETNAFHAAVMSMNARLKALA